MMNRFLLSLAATALFSGAAMAETVTFDFTTNDYGMVRTSGSDSGNYVEPGTVVTNGEISFTVGETEKAFRLWSDGLRIYKNKDCSMTLAVNGGGTIESVEYTTKAKISSYKLGADGETNTVSAKTFTVNTESLESPVIILSTSSTTAIETMVVTYSKSAGDLLPAGMSFSESTCSAIVGRPFTAPVLTKNTDASATYSSSDASVVSVDAATGAVEILAAGTATVTATCEANATYNRGTASYTVSVMGSYNSIAEFYTLDTDAKGLVNFPLTITYQSGLNTYVTDGTDFTLVYGQMPSYETGSIIPAGWIGQLAGFNGLPEIKIISDMTEPTESEEFTPRTVTSVDDSMLNEIVVLSDVTFATATPGDKTNFTGTAADVEYTFRNNFEIASVEAGIYDVTCAVATYSGNLQLYPISYTEPVVDGVSEIETTDGAAEYYNMQGVRVSNPEKGMFIRVEGNKAVKVVVK